MKRMTLDEFIKKYKATEYGDTWGEFVAQQNPDYVWTWVSAGDEYDSEYIYSGLHKVNSVGYFVSEKPNNGVDIELVQKNWNMTLDEFIEGVDAKPNHIHPENGFLFKDTPEESSFVDAQDDINVWYFYEMKDNRHGFTKIAVNRDTGRSGEVDIFRGWFIGGNPSEEWWEQWFELSANVRME